MAKFDVLNLEGQKVADFELNDAVFSVEPNPHLLWEVVKQQRASVRAGTHSTLRRSEVRGGGRKPYKQKGTGQARQGSTRSPNFVGGGKVFGPKPRDYSYSLPKKVKKAALCGALSLRVQEKRLIILDNMDLSAIKTKKMAAILKTFNAKSALVVDKLDNEKLMLSVRNLASAKYLPSEALNVYDILRYETLLLTRDIAKSLEARLLGNTITEVA